MAEAPEKAVGGPCSGLRVVDLSSVVSGPLCGRMLADLGAEVIKVESETSDVARYIPPLHKGHSAFFEQLNYGKKSLRVDVKSEEGLALAHRLIATADILIENSRPGVMDRLGLGYEALRKINGRLIYVAINGFGETGEFAGRAAYDQVIQGLVGFMPAQGEDKGPEAILCPIADRTTALWGVVATLGAIVHRERTGEGQKVVVNMLGSYASLIISDMMNNYTYLTADVEYAPRTYPNTCTTLDTSDGSVIGLILQTKQYESFCKALGRDDLLGHERFADPVKLLRNAKELYALVQDDVAQYTTAEFLALMAEHAVPFGRVNTLPEFLESDEAKACGTFVEIEDSELGVLRHLDFPVLFHRSPALTNGRGPLLGEHNEEIIGELRAGAGR